MEKPASKSCYQIQGGKKLHGAVTISGSKNATLPIMAAALLARAETRVRNVPNLADIAIMAEVLRTLGAKVAIENGEMHIDTRGVNNHEIPFDLMSRMRASIYVMGPLLAVDGHAKVAMPGGCAIGPRPINFHLAGLEQMGVVIDSTHGFIDAKCARLKASNIYLIDYPSVGTTANLMMAAVLADGTTTIENAAEEPHIVDLAWFLRSMGAKIRGAGTKTIVIEGVTKMHGAEHDMIPDQIEAGTFMVAGAITRGAITVKGACARDLKPITFKLREAGVTVTEASGEIKVTAKKKILPLRITTLPHPGFPTDMQPQMMAMLATSDGVSIIRETVWESRYMHVAELIRMGAVIEVQGNTAVVVGGRKLIGCEVVSHDLRAGAALVCAGLAAEGVTRVFGIDHIERGYENIEGKLAGLGADVVRVN